MKTLEGTKGVPSKGLNMYIGLQITSYPTLVSVLSDIWSWKMFPGQPEFRPVMSRESFKYIRQSLEFYSFFILDTAVICLLSQSRFLLDHFRRN